MAKVVIISEPLIEKFGRGFSDEDERPETPCSGDALNMATAVKRGLARLGEYTGRSQHHSVGILCGLGDDENGTIIRSFMECEGLDTNYVIMLKGRRTASYIIHRDEGGRKRSVEYLDRGPASAMCQFLEAGPHANLIDEALRDISQHADILVITGIGASRARSPSAFGRLVDLATTVRKRGGKVIIDLNHRFDAQTGHAKLVIV